MTSASPETGSDASPKAGASTLKLRIISGVVMAVVSLALTWWGGWPFALLAIGGGIILTAEWGGLVRDKYFDAAFWVQVIAPIVVTGLIYMGQVTAMEGAYGLLLVPVLVGLVSPAGTRMLSVAGVFYIWVPVFLLLHLRANEELGLPATLFVFMCVWLTDTAAYFSGRAIGGPKLMPSISPKKTWAGLIGGVTASAVAAAVMALYGGYAVVALVALAIVFAVVDQAGDLLESSIKRKVGQKDASTLIPGHGGLLDRVDGLIAVLAAAWLLSVVRGQSMASAILIW